MDPRAGPRRGNRGSQRNPGESAAVARAVEDNRGGNGG